jgi:hypothetical protein
MISGYYGYRGYQEWLRMLIILLSLRANAATLSKSCEALSQRDYIQDPQASVASTALACDSLDMVCVLVYATFYIACKAKSEIA